MDKTDGKTGKSEKKSRSKYYTPPPPAKAKSTRIPKTKEKVKPRTDKNSTSKGKIAPPKIWKKPLNTG